jgi:hypothetical protein
MKDEALHNSEHQCCSKGTATSYRWQYMLLFKVEADSKKMVNTLKIIMLSGMP